MICKKRYVIIDKIHFPDKGNTAGDKLKKYKKIIFAGYIFAVLWITLIYREFGEHRANLTPFWEFANVIRNVERWFYIKQIIGNLVMLMPLGFMLPTLKKVAWKHILATAFLFSVGIEITQFATGRGLMEFDDVFNNTVGAMIGYWIYIFVKNKKQK